MRGALTLTVLLTVVVVVAEEDDETVTFDENESSDVELSHDDALGVPVTKEETVLSLDGDGVVVTVEE